MRQFAFLGFNPITVNSYAFLFIYTPVERASDSLMVPTLNYLFSWLGKDLVRRLLCPTGELFSFILSELVLTGQGSPVSGISSCHATRCICPVLVFDSSW